MGKKVKPELRIKQKSIGFYEYQWKFFDKFPEFRPDPFCRHEIDEQIKLIEPELLEEDEKK